MCLIAVRMFKRARPGIGTIMAITEMMFPHVARMHTRAYLRDFSHGMPHAIIVQMFARTAHSNRDPAGGGRQHKVHEQQK
jgi:hypothetical protein